jgi:hypothetical protein
VKKIQGTVELQFATGAGGGSASAKVVALDENGYSTSRRVEGKPGAAGSLVLPLLEDVIYYVVTR